MVDRRGGDTSFLESLEDTGECVFRLDFECRVIETDSSVRSGRIGGKFLQSDVVVMLTEREERKPAVVLLDVQCENLRVELECPSEVSDLQMDVPEMCRSGRNSKKDTA